MSVLYMFITAFSKLKHGFDPCTRCQPGSPSKTCFSSWETPPGDNPGQLQTTFYPPFSALALRRHSAECLWNRNNSGLRICSQRHDRTDHFADQGFIRVGNRQLFESTDDLVVLRFGRSSRWRVKHPSLALQRYES